MSIPLGPGWQRDADKLEPEAERVGKVIVDVELFRAGCGRDALRMLLCRPGVDVPKVIEEYDREQVTGVIDWVDKILAFLRATSAGIGPRRVTLTETDVPILDALLLRLRTPTIESIPGLTLEETTEDLRDRAFLALLGSRRMGTKQTSKKYMKELWERAQDAADARPKENA